MEELNNHTKRGTWLINEVREFDDIVEECHKNNEDAIFGAVHPIMGAKGSEKADGKYDIRVRTVFTAPRARTLSGLDIGALYDEVTASPITFQGSRALRAYAALKGYVISSRDAKSA